MIELYRTTSDSRVLLSIPPNGHEPPGFIITIRSGS